MDIRDLGKKAFFIAFAVILGWLAWNGNIGKGFACIFVPGSLTGDVTNDGSGSTTTSTS